MPLPRDRRRRTSPPIGPLHTYRVRNLSYYGSVWVHGVWAEMSAYTGDYVDEIFIDQVGDFSPGIIRPCSHVRVNTSFIPFLPPYGTLKQGVEYASEATGNTRDVMRFTNDATIYGTEWKDFTQDARRVVDSWVRKVQEKVPSEASLPNFFLELRELPDLIQNLIRFGNTIGPLLRMSGRRILPDRFVYRKGHKFRLSRALKDDWLTFQFAIKPLIGDIQSLLFGYSEVEKRLNHLKKTYRKTVPVKLRPVKFTHKFDTSWAPLTTWFFGSVQVRYTHKQTFTVKSGCNVYHNVPVLDDALRKFHALLSYYGFNKPFTVAWEAIRFSWLVDYFTNLQQLIDQLPKTGDSFDGTITLSRAWTTFKDIRESWGYLRFELGLGTNSFSADIPFIYTKRLKFDREVGFSTTKGIVFDSDLSLTQMANIFALFK